MINRFVNCSRTKKTSFFKILNSNIFLILVVLSFSVNSHAQEQDFGLDLWNINCYNSLQSDPNVTPASFRGYYTQKLDVSENYGFNTTLSWNVNALPSTASEFNSANGKGTKYTGNIVDVKNKNFTYIHKRKGFPKAKYKITMRVWDDNSYLFIDNVRVPFSGDAGYGADRLIANCYELTPNSTIEVRTGNNGAGDSQCILDIVKTDILFAETLTTQDICENSEVILDARINVGNANFTQNSYKQNFESSSFSVPSESGWTVGTSTSANSGSNMIFAPIPLLNTEKTFKMGPFSTMGLNNIKMSFRNYYAKSANASGSIQISNNGTDWTTIQVFTVDFGVKDVFYPLDLDIADQFSNKPNVYLRFVYKKVGSGTNGFWAMDDFLVTGEGPANVTYTWSPTTGLSNPNIPNPTVEITSNQTYTLSVTAGNCSVTNDVVVNMTQTPVQPAVGPIHGSDWYIFAVDSMPGVSYTWSTNPIGAGNFPYGNVGSAITFIPQGNEALIVTPSNSCGIGTFPFIFGNPLPVTLTSFSVNCMDEIAANSIAITWSTASEQNSDYFSVEKSRDMDHWTVVSKQAASGSSNSNLNYVAEDLNPWNGLAYYRLRQVDFNGQQKVYDPISISCENETSSMTVFPNPTKGAFTVEINSTKNFTDVQLNMIDLTGKIVSSEMINLSKGVNLMNMSQMDLQKGVYFVRLEGGDNVIQPVRIVKE